MLPTVSSNEVHIDSTASAVGHLYQTQCH